MANNNILRQSNISLNRSTTYSGADIKVFVYRDLVDLNRKIKEGNFSSRDGAVTVDFGAPSDSVTFTNDSRTGLSDGGAVAKGREVVANKSFQKENPTNTVDLEYTSNAQSTSSFADASNSNTGSSIIGALGIDDVVGELGSLYGLNYSSFREKNAVRTLGRTHARHYTRGQRTIAGTMVFNVLQSHELLRFGNAVGNRHYAMLDQLEPFNLIVMFANEYGAVSVLHLFNVDVNTESQAMSVDDLLLTNTMNFYSQDLLPMEDIGNVFNSTAEMLYASIANKRFESFVSQIQNKKLTGLSSLDGALKGGSDSDTRIQKLLKRSRGLF